MNLFDLLYQGLTNCACILIINWEILHYDYWYVRYFCRVILTDLGLFLIGKICCLNICLWFCTFLDIYIWAIFVFAWTYSVVLLAEYELMTRGTWNFMEESEIEKAIRRHWVCCKFILVHILFLTFILVLFLLILVNIRSYIFNECVQNWTSNKLEILFKWEEEFNKYVLIK